MTGAAATERWCSPGSARLLTQSFDGEAVIFDRRDGRTHYLSPIAQQVLDTLEDGPLDFPSLRRRLEQTVGVSFEQEDLDQVRRILDQLVVLDLLTCQNTLQS